MKAVKNNKEYRIDESQVKSYQDRGFDIQDDTGSVIAYGRGRTVPYGEHEALKKELEELRDSAGVADNKDVADILRRFAQEHDVSLGNASSVSGIVKKIKEQLPKEGE